MSRIGILYPGGLGSALGRTIIETGGTAITCVSDRSDATRRRAAAANFIIVPSIEAVIQESELIISLVPPASALEASQRFAAALVSDGSPGSPSFLPPFLDLNSVSPQTKLRISEIFSKSAIRYIDGTFFGPTSRIGPDNMIALSGPDADQVAPLLCDAIVVKCVGDNIGQAAALKMALAILTKALPALFLEMICVSERYGQLDTELELMRRLYPGIMDFLERTIPTYPVHVERRVGELEEVSRWLHELGQCRAMTESAAAILDRLRIAGLERRNDWRFDDLLREISDKRILTDSRLTQVPYTA